MAKVSKNQRDNYREERRQNILEAATRIFALRGFEGATVAEIAREAGIAKGTIYLYFKSKDKIFRAIIEEFTFLPYLFDTLQDKEAPVAETFTRIAYRYMEYIREHGAILRIVMLEGTRYVDAPSEVYTQSAVKGNIEIAKYLQKQIAAGKLRNTLNPFLTARAFMGLLVTHIMMQDSLGGKYTTTISDEDWIRESVELLLNGMLP